MIIRDIAMERVPRENHLGGTGKVEFKHLVPVELLKGEAKMFSVLTFEPGAGLGVHDHVDNFEIYYILSGKATAIDDGKEVEVFPGDVIYTADGASHSITNTGDSDMVMLATVIFENK